MKKHIVIFLVTGLMLALASVSFASHYGDTYGYSTKGLSLGGAMCARADGWDSVYYNVAGLGRTIHLDGGKTQIGLAYQGNMPEFDLDISRNDVHADEDLEAGTFVLGLALDAEILMHLPYFVSSARLGVGLCVNDDMTALKLSDQEPQTHNYMRYGSEAQRLAVLTAVGIGLIDDMIGFGIGVNSAFEGNGAVLVDEVQLQTDPQSPNGQGLMEMKIKPNLLLGGYLNFGDLQLACAFRDETMLDIYPFETVSQTDVGNIVLAITMALADYYQPRMYVGGLAWKFGDFVLSADIEFQQWSRFRLSETMTLNNADVLVELDDIFVPRVGLEHHVTDRLDMYFGYYYQPSFVPDEAVTGTLNYLDNDKHVGSVGLAVDTSDILPLKGKSEFTIGYQLQYMVDRDVTKSSPTALNPSYSYGGMCHSVMVGLNIDLDI